MKKHIPEDIQEISRAALKEIPKSVSRPAMAAAAKVEAGWLWSFQRNTSKKPAFVFVIRLYNYLLNAYPALLSDPSVLAEAKKNMLKNKNSQQEEGCCG